MSGDTTEPDTGIRWYAPIAVALAITLAGCGEKPQRPVPKFGHGEIVKTKLDGHKGMIVSIWCWSGASMCDYRVRFAAHEMATDVSLLGGDGAIETKPYSLVSMQEFELEAAH